MKISRGTLWSANRWTIKSATLEIPYTNTANDQNNLSFFVRYLYKISIFTS